MVRFFIGGGNVRPQPDVRPLLAIATICRINQKCPGAEPMRRETFWHRGAGGPVDLVKFE
jgi:hypothetical protein